MKPDFMKHAVLVPFLVCAASLAVRAEAILGRFQPEDEVARAVVGLTGPARVNLNAVRIVDLAGRKGDELVLAFELRVTRHDGKSDRHALDLVRNGRVKLFDTTGKKVFEADSPLQKQVPPMDRVPGVWMTARCPLDGLAANSGRLEVAELFDYNDIPHKAEQTGIDYEVRNARIELKPSPADDLSRCIKAVESTKPLTTCNPVDIEYMIDHGNGKVGSDGLPQGVYVQSADPAIVVFKGEYWLFASHGDGYWFSSDLAKWTFVQIDVTKGILKEFLKYAPATCVVGDTLYLCHSEGGRMLRTKDPHDPNLWEDVGKPDGWMDPGMFYDDPATGGDGYVYLYRGLSHRNPVQVIKLDPKNGMRKVDGPYDVGWPDKLNRGFEVPGDFNTHFEGNDTQEGPWPTKANGRYYVMCAVPGTADASYCDNCYVSDSPMGPFTYAFNSPVIWKSTGFTQGAGHGALFQDMGGRWWKIDTCRVRGFNRRLVLVPAMFDERGDLYTNTVLSDHPFYVPSRSKDPFGNPGPGWMLLSYGKRATASSNPGGATLAFNERIQDSWIPATDNPGEWLQVDLGKVYAVRSVQVNFDDVKCRRGGRAADEAYRYILEFSQDGKLWHMMLDRRSAKTNRQHEYVEFAEKVGARYIRLTNKGSVPGGGRFAVCALRVFGEGGGTPPEAVDMGAVYADRRADDNRAVGIEWPAARGAQGYIIRFGLSPDRLFHHYIVYGRRSYVVRSLMRGLDYWFTVDAFNESGVTRGPKAVPLKATGPMREGYDVDGNNPAIVGRTDCAAVMEAESATFGGTGVRTAYEVRASGAKAVLGLGARDTFAEFAGVKGIGAREGTLRISYSAQYGAKVSVKVNGAAMAVSLPKTTGWPTYATVDVSVKGLSAKNTIRIEGTGEGFHLDWVGLFK